MYQITATHPSGHGAPITRPTRTAREAAYWLHRIETAHVERGHKVRWLADRETLHVAGDDIIQGSVRYQVIG